MAGWGHREYAPPMDDETRGAPAPGKPEDRLSVVCFGASAGGLEAYGSILSLLPADTGMAYIIVHHQPANGQALLLKILPRVTEMPARPASCRSASERAGGTASRSS